MNNFSLENLSRLYNENHCSGPSIFFFAAGVVRGIHEGQLPQSETEALNYVSFIEELTANGALSEKDGIQSIASLACQHPSVLVQLKKKATTYFDPSEALSVFALSKIPIEIDADAYGIAITGVKRNLEEDWGAKDIADVLPSLVQCSNAFISELISPFLTKIFLGSSDSAEEAQYILSNFVQACDRGQRYELISQTYENFRSQHQKNEGSPQQNEAFCSTLPCFLELEEPEKKCKDMTLEMGNDLKALLSQAEEQGYVGYTILPWTIYKLYKKTPDNLNIKETCRVSFVSAILSDNTSIRKNAQTALSEKSDRAIFYSIFRAIFGSFTQTNSGEPHAALDTAHFLLTSPCVLTWNEKMHFGNGLFSALDSHDPSNSLFQSEGFSKVISAIKLDPLGTAKLFHKPPSAALLGDSPLARMARDLFALGTKETDHPSPLSPSHKKLRPQ